MQFYLDICHQIPLIVHVLDMFGHISLKMTCDVRLRSKTVQKHYKYKHIETKLKKNEIWAPVAVKNSFCERKKIKKMLYTSVVFAEVTSTLTNNPLYHTGLIK